MRKICYISGTRADFGLMKTTLNSINENHDLDLNVIITGMHLLEKYGNTWKELHEIGFEISGRVEVSLTGSSGAEMSLAIGKQIIEFTNILLVSKPDVIVLLGDRGEMLAGAIAAMYQNIPIIHIHGGELSGSIDEPVRHAISKLAHYHFTASKKSKLRLIKMGEIPSNIFVTGAPGLDEIKNTELLDRSLILSKYELKSKDSYLLFLFHPITQQIEIIKNQIDTIMKSLLKSQSQVLILMPNADAGAEIISNAIKKYENLDRIKIVIHAPRLEFLSLIAYAKVLIGNSSSGIIEAASLKTPVLNLGDRQKNRERNSNTIDVDIISSDIDQGLAKAIKMQKGTWNNVYGDGNSTQKIIKLLRELPLNSKVMEKINAY